MNRETLKHANEIINEIDTLNDLNRVMYASYPQFLGNDIKVNSAGFDEITLKRLKAIITNFIDDRKKELQEEFKKL